LLLLILLFCTCHMMLLIDCCRAVLLPLR
jgi:hypothetical protein